MNKLGVLLCFALLLYPSDGIVAARAAEISLPWIAQKDGAECGRAVLASLAARKGGDPEAFYRRLPVPPDPVHGYSIPEMQRFGMQIGVDLVLQAPATVVIAGECLPAPAVAVYFKKLAGLIRAGQPVVVPVESSPDAGHYVVLVGADGGGFTVLDPAFPNLRRISGPQLAAAMCKFGYIALASR